LKGTRWSLLKDSSRLEPEATADLDALIAKMTTVGTARAWVYKEQLREILERKQINIVRTMLQHCCTCVMRSKVEPMTEVAALVRRHLECIRRLGTAPSNQRLPGGHQRPVPGRQTPRVWLRPPAHHQDRRLPDRRQARLPSDQS